MTIINAKQAASMLGYSAMHTRYLARAGMIPSHRPYPGARRVFFYKEEIEKCIVCGADQ